MSDCSKHKWIAVDNILPEPTDEVLEILYDDGSEDVSRFLNGYFYVYDIDVKNITHWRYRISKPFMENKNQ